jgi:hypothetical protein
MNGINTLRQIRENKQDSNTIKYRLSTEQLKQNIRIYLSGYTKQQYVDEEGDLQEKWVSQPEMRKLNEKGIQSVMHIIESAINSAVVQGNTDENEYREILGDFHEALFRHLFVNGPKYGLADEDFEIVVETITHLVRMFTSRTIGNLERKSYENTMRVNENQTVSNNGGGGITGAINGMLGGGRN